MRSAYQRPDPDAAVATELETQSRQPCRVGDLLGRFRRRVGGDAQACHRNERQRQEPDEQAIREGAGDDPAADLLVAVDHLERGVDRGVAAALDLGSLLEAAGPRLQRCDARRDPPAVVVRRRWPARRSSLTLGRARAPAVEAPPPGRQAARAAPSSDSPTTSWSEAVDRHRDQGADHAEQRAEERHAAHDEEAGDVRGLPLDRRRQQVVLDLLVDRTTVSMISAFVRPSSA